MPSSIFSITAGSTATPRKGRHNSANTSCLPAGMCDLFYYEQASAQRDTHQLCVEYIYYICHSNLVTFSARTVTSQKVKQRTSHTHIMEYASKGQEEGPKIADTGLMLHWYELADRLALERRISVKVGASRTAPFLYQIGNRANRRAWCRSRLHV